MPRASDTRNHIPVSDMQSDRGNRQEDAPGAVVCEREVEYMDRFGLTEERYSQMMAFWNNDEEAVRDVVREWGVENCNKGYAIFNYDGTGLLEIEAIGDVGAFNDQEATARAIADGIKIIPVDQLPVNMSQDMRWYGWIDTPDNRQRIEAYCKKWGEVRKREI